MPKEIRFLRAAYATSIANKLQRKMVMKKLNCSTFYSVKNFAVYQNQPEITCRFKPANNYYRDEAIGRVNNHSIEMNFPRSPSLGVRSYGKMAYS